MHPVVQNVMRDLVERPYLTDIEGILDTLDKFERTPQYWVERITELISIGYPMCTSKTWMDCGRYNSHATTCIEHGEKYQLESEMLADLESSVAFYTFHQGNLLLAHKRFKSALRMYERVCGEFSSKTAKAIHDFGECLLDLENYSEAMMQFERLLQFPDPQSWEGIITKSTVTYSLGRAWFGLGKYDRALRLFGQAWEINQASKWTDPMEAARILSFISDVLSCKGELRKASHNCEEALKISTQILGEDHIETNTLLTLSASILSRRGQHRKALQKFEKALKLYEAAFGKGHVASAGIIGQIGLIYFYLGKWNKALEEFKRATELLEKAAGKDHSMLATAVWSLGSVYFLLGQRKEALAHWERSVEISGSRLCNGHKERMLHFCKGLTP